MMEVGMELPVSGKAQCPSLLLGPSLTATLNGVWFVVATAGKEGPVVVAAEFDLIAVPIW